MKFGTPADGYAMLATRIIYYAFIDNRKGNFNLLQWLGSSHSDLWLDYLDLNKEFVVRLLSQ